MLCCYRERERERKFLKKGVMCVMTFFHHAYASDDSIERKTREREREIERELFLARVPLSVSLSFSAKREEREREREIARFFSFSRGMEGDFRHPFFQK